MAMVLTDPAKQRADRLAEAKAALVYAVDLAVTAGLSRREIDAVVASRPHGR